MNDQTNPNTGWFRMMPSDESVEGCLGASSAGQGEVTPSALAPTPPLDLAALRTRAMDAKKCGYGLESFAPDDVLALIARVEELAGESYLHETAVKESIARAERAEAVFERVEQQALGAEANLEAALKVSRERLARAEAAEAKVARVEALAERYDRHDQPRSVHRFSAASALRAALDGGA